ncbi:MAG TPA: helix-turn-helix transcriptional regulator [Steroidobacteraceae bacterium]|nr:helix-turn-helix transcriptional regulator [Steroidobacteraceae bacterium]
MVTRKKRSSKRDHETGSGNVYADLALADPEAMLVKAKLVTRIAELLASRDFTQTEGAALLGIPQPKLSNLLNGRFRGFSERKLMDFLTRLGSDVEIVVRSGTRAGRRGSVSVVIAS